MDFQTLTDLQLDAMRRASKNITNPAARWVTKGGHREKNYALHDVDSPPETYRVFMRVSATNASVFSVGLARVYSPEEVLVLVRYNGSYHSHRNILEGTRLSIGYHRHLTTQRYIAAGLDPTGYAEPVSDYNSVEGAFDCLCRDCGIAAPKVDPFQIHLEF